MTRYVIIGAGAVGATVAAELHGAGRDVVLIARGQHLELLRARGLDYIRPDGTRRLDLPVAGGADEVALRPGDVLVLATKSQDTEAALQEWAWRGVGSSSAAELLPIVLLQNGLDSVRSARRRFATVVDAVVLIPSSYLDPGEVVSPSTPTVGAIFLGSTGPGTASGGPDDVAESIARDLRQSSFAVRVVPDIARWKAAKLVANIAHNLDAIYSPSPLRARAEAILQDEARGVLAASGIDVAELGPDAIDLSGFSVQKIEGYERGGSSTWQSLRRTGSNETDFLNGEVVLLARLGGLPAPANAAVQARVARAAREGTAPGSLGDDDLLRTVPALRPRVLIGVEELREELDGPNPPVLLDVRWALGDPNGREHYAEAHLPGAVYVDLDTELAGPAEPLRGRHPLPEITELQKSARSWGISAQSPVVVYDNVGGLSAARAWWLLRWGGHGDVRILDGALPAWLGAGLPVEAGVTVPEAGDVELAAGHLPVLSADEAARLAVDGVLLDARAGERFRGEVEPIDPRAGHIPGAVSAPTGENLEPSGTFLAAERLRARFDQLGVSGPVGVYCGSGVTASHEIAALAAAGIDAALFPGSWSAWSSDPTRPVATG
jgi:thiosulfate/3-mercaptopyruvate sulfurtransferase